MAIWPNHYFLLLTFYSATIANSCSILLQLGWGDKRVRKGGGKEGERKEEERRERKKGERKREKEREKEGRMLFNSTISRNVAGNA